jgi:para-aminobenzoate synthetase/4-amino-4-deoxychorismate lyase
MTAIRDLLSGTCVLLEDRLSPGTNARLYRNPLSIVCCTQRHKIENAFDEIEAGLKSGLHAAGFLSYELGYALEPKLEGKVTRDCDAPLLWFGLFGPPEHIPQSILDEAFAAIGPPPPLEDVRYGHDQATHARKVEEILDFIRGGDIYQANLTFPISFRIAGDRLRLYAALRSRQPVSHGGLAIDRDMLGETTILSVSPELFLEVKDNIATTRPMKGTSPRGANPAADLEKRHVLYNDPKQRAENLMIVDLLRNDLSRIAAFGTVHVPSLFEVETYPGFHAMSSTITATLRDGISLREKIAALFPCGSIVGAPKIRAAEILRDLEIAPRGVYTGALGAIAPNGDLRFNVAIRTALIDRDGLGTYGVGGGIVAESCPEDEYEEALLKARVLTGLAKPYDLIETFRWDPSDGYVRLPHHLDRLTGSATQLGFPSERKNIEAQLTQLETILIKEEANPQRIRLALSRTGNISITRTPLPMPVSAILRVCIAEARLDPADPFLRHKTSLRDIYETAYARATDAGRDEAIFLNTKGDIAEASRNTIFVVDDGKLLTPPLSSGVLPGVLRQTLIESGEAVEQRMSLADLVIVSKWFLGNSLHGLREASLVKEGLLF